MNSTSAEDRTWNLSDQSLSLPLSQEGARWLVGDCQTPNQVVLASTQLSMKFKLLINTELSMKMKNVLQPRGLGWNPTWTPGYIQT